MTDVSYDQLISEFIDARVDSDSAVWRQAAIAFYMKEQMMIPAKTISSDTGYSPRYISQLVKTFSHFPEPDSRAADMSFSIHMVCAESGNAIHWLDLACKEGWSVRDLKSAIKGEKPPTPEEEKARKLWDKVEQALEDEGPGAEYIWQQINSKASSCSPNLQRQSAPDPGSRHRPVIIASTVGAPTV